VTKEKEVPPMVGEKRKKKAGEAEERKRVQVQYENAQVYKSE
jgi:hypothetical protein